MSFQASLLRQANKQRILGLVVSASRASVLQTHQIIAEALMGFSDPLQVATILEYVDIILWTAGSKGLYLCGHSENALKIEPTHWIKSGTLADFKRWAFSYPIMVRKDSYYGISPYDPYMGGTEKIRHTNGAGNSALSYSTA